MTTRETSGRECSAQVRRDSAQITKFERQGSRATAPLKLDGLVPNVKSIELAARAGLKGAAQSVVYSGAGPANGWVDRGLGPGAQYRYQLTVTDDAANKTTQTRNYLARGALLPPAPGERVTKPPLLVWSAKSAAPTTTTSCSSAAGASSVRGRPSPRLTAAARLDVPRASVQTAVGLLHWFVWPGFGSLSAGQYGKMLGGSTFTFGGPG